MKFSLILLAFIALLIGSCSKGGVRKDIPLSQKKGSLAYDAEVFRSNLSHAKKNSYTVTDPVFLTALSNEFAVYDMYRERRLSNAIDSYTNLTNKFFSDRSFLFQRTGICYFKLGDLSRANKYIQLSIFEGADDSELYFYRSMLYTFYKRDPDRALNALKYVDLSRVDLNKQDYLAYQATIYNSLKDYRKAYELYQAAILVDPKRFYMNYDLTYFLQHAGMKNEVSFYIRKSFSQLSESKDKPFRVKAYRQMVLLNRLERKETLEHRYNFSDGYEYFLTPLYYYDDPRPIERMKSFGIPTPLKEKRLFPNDKIHYPVFEDYLDTSASSSIILGLSMLDISGILHPYLKESTKVPKIVGTNSTFIILSPTNVYVLSTNQYVATNSKNYIITNQSNAVMIKNLNFTYYQNTEYFDMNKRGAWDYVFFGFNKTNRAVVTFYYPDRNEWSTVHFNIKKPDAQFVIQDMNGDGRPELMLLDDDVYFLTNEKML